jgi:protein TonB
MARWRAAFPAATVVPLPEVGHWPQITAPEATLRALQAFLAPPPPPEAPKPLEPQPVKVPEAPKPLEPQPVKVPEAPKPLEPQPVKVPEAPKPLEPQPVKVPEPAPAPKGG